MKLKQIIFSDGYVRGIEKSNENEYRVLFEDFRKNRYYIEFEGLISEISDDLFSVSIFKVQIENEKIVFLDDDLVILLKLEGKNFRVF